MVAEVTTEQTIEPVTTPEVKVTPVSELSDERRAAIQEALAQAKSLEAPEPPAPGWEWNAKFHVFSNVLPHCLASNVSHKLAIGEAKRLAEQAFAEFQA
jgi:hypothetical protein